MEKIRHTAKFHTSGKTNVLMAVLSAAADVYSKLRKDLRLPLVNERGGGSAFGN